MEASQILTLARSGPGARNVRVRAAQKPSGVSRRRPSVHPSRWQLWRSEPHYGEPAKSPETLACTWHRAPASPSLRGRHLQVVQLSRRRGSRLRGLGHEDNARRRPCHAVRCHELRASPSRTQGPTATYDRAKWQCHHRYVPASPPHPMEPRNCKHCRLTCRPTATAVAAAPARRHRHPSRPRFLATCCCHPLAVGGCRPCGLVRTRGRARWDACRHSRPRGWARFQTERSKRSEPGLAKPSAMGSPRCPRGRGPSLWPSL